MQSREAKLCPSDAMVQHDPIELVLQGRWGFHAHADRAFLFLLRRDSTIIRLALRLPSVLTLSPPAVLTIPLSSITADPLLGQVMVKSRGIGKVILVSTSSTDTKL